MSKDAQSWEHLIERYMQARAAFDDATAAYDAAEGGYDEAHEGRCAVARDAEIALEDALLAMTPPDLAAVACALKIFALRHCGVDIDDDPGLDDKPEGPILRRLHAAVLAAA